MCISFLLQCSQISGLGQSDEANKPWLHEAEIQRPKASLGISLFQEFLDDDIPSNGFLAFRDHPLLQPNYLSTENDRWELRESVKLSREVFSQKAFDEFRDVEILPGPDTQTDEEIDEYAR